MGLIQELRDFGIQELKEFYLFYLIDIIL